MNKKLGFLVVVLLLTTIAWYVSLQNDTVDRPIFHFTPASGWMNDPNGLIKIDDTFHLYYQFYPGGWGLDDGRYSNALEWGPMHWGHATSQDLIRWKHQPIALYPDKKIDNTNVEGSIWSGSIVHDLENSSGFGNNATPPLVSIYTNFDTSSAAGNQRQSLAYSLDNGYSWIKYLGNPVIPNNDLSHFRDPDVFKYNNNWKMVLTCGVELCFYDSLDLKLWNFVGKFTDNKLGNVDLLECPDLFPMKVMVNGKEETKWVLLVSTQQPLTNGRGYRVRYFIGDFNGSTFIKSNQTPIQNYLDFGPDFYAAKTWGTQPRFVIAWMANPKYASLVPATKYRGSMTLPRSLNLKFINGTFYLNQTPIEIKSMAKSINIFNNLTSHPIVLTKAGKYKALIMADLEIQDLQKIEFSLLKYKNTSFKIIFDKDSSLLSIDRSHISGFQFKDDQNQVLPVNLTNNHLKFSILIDVNSIEIFVNQGDLVLSYLIFPDNKDEITNEFFSIGALNASNITVYEF